MNVEPRVTANEVAQHLGVAKDSVYRWRERNCSPTQQIVGRLWKFQLSDVNEWVRAGGANGDSSNPFGKNNKGEQF